MTARNGRDAWASVRECHPSGYTAKMDELRVQVDEDTARRVQEFADSINITIEEAATRLLRIAATVREVMSAKGLLAGGDTGEFLVSFERMPDGIRSVDFRPMK